MDRLTAEQVAALERSCAASGVPVKVLDSSVIRAVVALLGGPVGSAPAPARSARRAEPPARSDNPHWLDPVGV
jgi:hypothetical protein